MIEEQCIYETEVFKNDALVGQCRYENVRIPKADLPHKEGSHSAVLHWRVEPTIVVQLWGDGDLTDVLICQIRELAPGDMEPVVYLRDRCDKPLDGSESFMTLDGLDNLYWAIQKYREIAYEQLEKEAEKFKY